MTVFQLPTLSSMNYQLKPNFIFVRNSQLFFFDLDLCTSYIRIRFHSQNADEGSNVYSTPTVDWDVLESYEGGQVIEMDVVMNAYHWVRTGTPPCVALVHCMSLEVQLLIPSLRSGRAHVLYCVRMSVDPQLRSFSCSLRSRSYARAKDRAVGS